MPSFLKKNFFPKSRLFKTYFIFISAAVVICLLGSMLPLMYLVSTSWIQDRLSRMLIETQYIASLTEVIYNYDLDELANIKGTLELMSQNENTDFFICNYEGDIIICKEEEDASLCHIHNPLKISQNVIIEAEIGLKRKRTDTMDGSYEDAHFSVVYPVRYENTDRDFVIIASQPLFKGLQENVVGFMRAFLWAGLITLVIWLISVFMLTQRLTKPLQDMSDATKSYAKGNFGYRVKIKGRSTELTELAGALNSMAGALAALESSRRNFVANVSHELKTPMTSIGGFIDGILDGTIAKKDEERYLRIVSDEVKRLSRLTAAMLNLSKIEEGTMDLAPVKYNISEQLVQTVLSFEYLISGKSVMVEGLDMLPPVHVRADKDLIHQVIYNLIDNAVKFTPENGKISISAETGQNFSSVKITNTGSGIPSDEIDKVFERFYKLDKSRSLDVKSVGLGLYIVKTIVTLNGGELRAESIPNEYTVFSFTLPAN
ncbi:MAG: HAMP domain-containing histidine kinase [Oscillospiraceae bacterium]|nr:HAMP domain-containing histidine kinase [Oscillospiraceae bacterium]